LPGKRVIFVALPLLLAPLVYGTVYSSTSEFEACATPNNSPCFNYNKGGWTHEYCCWEEDDIMNPGEKIKWCQDCIVDPRHPNPTCEPAEDVTDLGQN
jgi:hypothetical protein